jgi:NADPH2:quinone reductase
MRTSRSMRALVLERHNGPFILTEAELPAITAGQVLVRIKASGVNPLDTKMRTGNAAHARVELPWSTALQAHVAVEMGTTVGKIVVEIDD